MDLHVPLSIANEVFAASPEDAYLKSALEKNQYRRKVILDGLRLQRHSVKVLRKLAKDEDRPWVNDLMFLYASLSGDKPPTFTDMHDLKDGIQQLMSSKRIKNYVFRRGAFKSVLPFLLTDLKFSEDARYNSVKIPSVSFKLLWSTSSASSANERTFDFSPHTLANVLTALGVNYVEKHEKVRRLQETYSILINVTASTPVSVEDFLHHYELFVETQELIDLYQKQVDRFLKFLPSYGKQFRVRGSSLDNRSMLIEGRPSRAILTTIPQVVVEEHDGSDTGSRQSSIRPSRKSGRRAFSGYYESDYSDFSFVGSTDSADDQNFTPEAVAHLSEIDVEDLMPAYTPDGESTELSVLVPLHPTLNIFHLELQAFFDIHVNNLVPYEYRKDMEQMLILPDNMKRLSRMLVATSHGEDAEDVIENKSQATIVACIGDPGLGKTLMAEVMAEACEKPLYKTQAAQLGLDPTSLEANLYRILRRAERWGAVVMIDEANAYIHERGHDIKQNAVVGVFLRLLEYFRGTLILTTNQTRDSLKDDSSFDIDDAILSRCQAVFKFELPDHDLSARLWKLQAELMKLELSEKMIQRLVARYRLSGRSIRNLLRLSSAWAHDLGENLAYKHFIDCEGRIPKTKSEKIICDPDD